MNRFTFDDDWRPLTKPSSLKKQKIGLTTKNYYSAATLWSTSEFPIKRKAREGDWGEEKSKKRRSEEDEKESIGVDWFKRKDERYSREACGSES